LGSSKAQENEVQAARAEQRDPPKRKKGRKKRRKKRKKRKTEEQCCSGQTEAAPKSEKEEEAAEEEAEGGWAKTPKRPQPLRARRCGSECAHTNPAYPMPQAHPSKKTATRTGGEQRTGTAHKGMGSPKRRRRTSRRDPRTAPD
jgi:hypothetical protein